MAKADDPIDQLRSVYVRDQDFVTGFTWEMVAKAFPVLGRAISFLRSTEQREVLKEFNDHLLNILKAQERDLGELLARTSEPEISRLVAVAFERMLWGASKKKARRFAAVIADSLNPADEQIFEDAASFIRALAELSENDLIALRHLYTHQVDLVLKDSTPAHRSFFEDGRMEQLLQTSRIPLEEFFSRCERLSGYGLALELDGRLGGINANMKAYRITVLGGRLVSILLQGEKASLGSK